MVTQRVAYGMLMMSRTDTPLPIDWAVSHVPDSDMIARTIAGCCAWIGML